MGEAIVVGEGAIRAVGDARAELGCRSRVAGEAAARGAGFTTGALMATLPGVPFYAAHGYVAGAPVVHDCGGVAVRFVPMTKPIFAAN